MNRTGYLKCSCQHCGGHIEFPVEAIETSIDCPHCHWPTELRLETPDLEADLPRRRTWVPWALAGIVVLFLLGLSAPMLLKRALTRQRAAAAASASGSQTTRTDTRATPEIVNAFEVHNLGLERKPGSSLIYAAGTLKNRKPEKRFGIRVELTLLDRAGANVGTASDYLPVIEPSAELRFQALVVNANAATAKVTAIREDE